MNSYNPKYNFRFTGVFIMSKEVGEVKMYLTVLIFFLKCVNRLLHRLITFKKNRLTTWTGEVIAHFLFFFRANFERC